MKEVIIKFEPFVFKQTVFIKDENGVLTKDKVPQKELASYISLLENVEQVHLFGNDKYALKLKEECITKYKINNIDICINK